MTQEIYDYFLIRSLILNRTTEELVEAVGDRSSFLYFVEKTLKLTEREDFILTSSELLKRVETALFRYRFDYNNDKEINPIMNGLVNKLRKYKEMDISEKKAKCQKWIEEETLARELPPQLSDLEFLYASVSADMNCICLMQGKDIGEAEKIVNLLTFLGIINITLYRFPDVELEQGFIDNTAEQLKALKKLRRIPVIEKRILNKTIKKINNLQEKQKIKTLGHK